MTASLGIKEEGVDQIPVLVGEQSGLQSMQFRSLSFHIKDASTAAVMGMEGTSIAKIGWWRSYCCKLYVPARVK